METLPREPPDAAGDCGSDELSGVDGPDGTTPSQSNGFELAASKDTVIVGEESTFTLTNVGDERTGIGEIYKYGIQRRNGDEWTGIYHTPGSLWTDLAILVPPGGGYEWQFTFDRNGLERQNGHNPTYYVCSSIESGTYRFAFWGLEETVTVEFTVEAP